MRAFLQRIAATIKAQQMIAPGQLVLVAFSGGADSTALLHALKQLGHRLCACHVHHGLRGAEADADAQHAAAFAASLGVPLAEKRADVRSAAKERKLSLETAAREVRYALLAEAAREFAADRIATGHTADDQAETVLLNLLRGAGPSGLAGIPPVRGDIIRPLLGVSRAEVREYCAAAGLSYREDRSNLDRRYTRNRIRHETMPALQQIQPNLTATLCRLAEIMRSEDEYLDSLLPAGQAQVQEGEVSLPLAELAALPVALQRRRVRGALAAVKGDDRDLEFERIEAVLEMARRGETGAVIELPGGLAARRGYGELVIRKGESEAAPKGEWGLSTRRRICLSELGLILTVEPGEDTSLSDDPNVAVLDADRLQGELRVRLWQPGDRFVPLGLSEPVKLQDFFVNAKVPRVRRHRLPIVESGGEIVWVVGERISERHKVTASTRRTVRLQVRPIDQGEH
jgi:tRNA(Ile)-lysidine synthase